MTLGEVKWGGGGEEDERGGSGRRNVEEGVRRRRRREIGRGKAWLAVLAIHLFLSAAIAEDPSPRQEGQSQGEESQGKDTEQGQQCGRPGRPANGTVSTSGRFYFPGEHVAYKCLEGFVLVGPEERTCERDGTWSDHVPLCDFNLARGKRTLQSATLWSYTPDLAVDGNPDTCCFTPRGPDARWWQVHLGHKFTVLSVGVTISPGSPQEFTIFVIELLTDNKALYKPCATFKGVFQTHKAVFQCNGGVGHPGQFVYIRDDRDEHEYFGLCEVEVFAFRERIPCGEPEVPVEGEVERENIRTSRFSCRPGYTLEGDAKLTCSSKGTWEGQTPRCKETQCPAPAHVPHGSLDVANFRGVYGHGTVVTFSCNTGYLLKGDATATCDHTGHWTSPPPLCRAVWCDTPPAFPHASYTLLNTSTGIAVYTCHPGHLLHPDSGETVTTCNDAGIWQPINITCVAATVGQPGVVGQDQVVGRGGEGRALSYDLAPTSPDPAPEGPKGLVAALALVAGLLTTAMLVVGGLLARRPLLATLRPLLNTAPSKTPAATASSVAGGRSGSHHTPAHTTHHPITYAHTTHNASYSHTPHHPDYTHATHLPSYTNPYAHNHDDHSTCTLDPPYERVGTRSEHSYETLRKKSCFSDHVSDEGSGSEAGIKEAGYETVSEVGAREAGYETVREAGARGGEAREAGYETVRAVEGREVDNEGYETVREKNEGRGEKEAGYETVREADGKDAGYETVKDAEGKDAGYETVRDVSGKGGGYETVRETEEKEAGYETVKEMGVREGDRRETAKPQPPPPRIPPPRSLTPLSNLPCSPILPNHLPLSPSPSNPLPLSPNPNTSSITPTSSLPRSLTPSKSRSRSPNSPSPLPHSPSPLPHTPSPLPPTPSPLPCSPTPDDSVPDILQHLACPTDEVPPEILALYARVDKSKKRRRDPVQSSSNSPCSLSTISPGVSNLDSNTNNHVDSSSSNSTNKHIDSNSSNSINGTSSPSTSNPNNSSPSNTDSPCESQGRRDATQKLVQKFNRMNSDEGNVRPLPPLPAAQPLDSS